MILEAPAKLNLGLRILRRRSDGYHEIESIFHTLAWGDTLTIEPGEGIRLEVMAADPGTHGPADWLADVPAGPANLAWRAAEAILSECDLPGADIVLRKRVPPGSGLGGGSSDAAAVLMGLPTLYGTQAGPDRLEELAQGLGADVPFFLTGGCALVEGIGERITPLDGAGGTRAVIGLPDLQIGTAWAYQAANYTLTRSETYRDYLASAEGVPALIRSGRLDNDLLDPVSTAHPSIRGHIETLLEAGAFLASMSGSGSAVFGLFEEAAAADSAADALGASGVSATRTHLA